MQAGYVPNARLGTNLEVSLTPPAAAPTYAQAVFDQSLNHIEGVNERNIVYPKFATTLQGLTLSKVPSGGFSGPPPNVLLGADVGGAMFNASNPTYFNQPGYTGGCSKYVEIGNGVPLTGEKEGAELVYMTADGKLRDPRGASTTARTAQEAAQGARRAARAHADMFGVSNISALPAATQGPPPPTTALAAVAAAAAPPIRAPPPAASLAVFNNSGNGRNNANYSGASGGGRINDGASNNGGVVIVAKAIGEDVDSGVPNMPDVRQFGRDVLGWAQGKLQPAYQDNFWAYNWPYVLCILLFLLFIVFFIVAIAKMSSNGNGSGSGNASSGMAVMALLPPAQTTGLRPVYAY